MALDKQPPNPPAPGKPTISTFSIVPWPKVVFFYPLMLACFLCGGIQYWWGTAAPGSTEIGFASALAGTIFVVVFLVNMMIITFDFPGIKALAFVFALIALVLVFILLNIKYGILGPISEILKTLRDHLAASTALYFIIGGILGFMVLCGYFLNHLWNFWTLEHNRLIHHRGPLGDAREYPCIDLQVEKVIVDVFEYLLLKSGTLIFRIPGSEPIRLENVLFIKSKEQKIKELLGQLRVTVSTH